MDTKAWYLVKRGAAGSPGRPERRHGLAQGANWLWQQHRQPHCPGPYPQVWALVSWALLGLALAPCFCDLHTTNSAAKPSGPSHTKHSSYASWGECNCQRRKSKACSSDAWSPSLSKSWDRTQDETSNANDKTERNAAGSVPTKRHQGNAHFFQRQLAAAQQDQLGQECYE